MFITTTLSDKNVVATKVGNPYPDSETFNFFKDEPQLKHLSAKELCTTLHFLHSFDIMQEYYLF